MSMVIAIYDSDMTGVNGCLDCPNSDYWWSLSCGAREAILLFGKTRMYEDSSVRYDDSRAPIVQDPDVSS